MAINKPNKEMAEAIAKTESEHNLPRVCWACKFYQMCVLRIAVTENSKHLKMNIDDYENANAPKTINHIYEAMAGACFNYESRNTK